jgi:cell pole-organizing protein PopZ
MEDILASIRKMISEDRLDPRPIPDQIARTSIGERAPAPPAPATAKPAGWDRPAPVKAVEPSPREPSLSDSGERAIPSFSSLSDALKSAGPNAATARNASLGDKIAGMLGDDDVPRSGGRPAGSVRTQPGQSPSLAVFSGSRPAGAASDAPSARESGSAPALHPVLAPAVSAAPVSGPAGSGPGLEPDRERVQTVNGHRAQPALRPVADVRSKAPHANGTHVNGVNGAPVNGTALNGSGLNGSARNGAEHHAPGLNGTAHKSAAHDGSAHNGSGVNGSSVNGSALNGSAVNRAKSTGINGAGLNGSAHAGAINGSALNSAELNGAAQAKVVEAKTLETRTAETKPVDSKTAETKTGETKPAEPKSAEIKSAESNSRAINSPEIKAGDFAAKADAAEAAPAAPTDTLRKADDASAGAPSSAAGQAKAADAKPVGANITGANVTGANVSTSPAQSGAKIEPAPAQMVSAAKPAREPVVAVPGVVSPVARSEPRSGAAAALANARSSVYGPRAPGASTPDPWAANTSPVSPEVANELAQALKPATPVTPDAIESPAVTVEPAKPLASLTPDLGEAAAAAVAEFFGSASQGSPAIHGGLDAKAAFEPAELEATSAPAQSVTPSSPFAPVGPVAGADLKEMAAASRMPSEMLVDAVMNLVQEQPSALSVLTSGADFIRGVHSALGMGNSHDGHHDAGHHASHDGGHDGPGGVARLPEGSAAPAAPAKLDSSAAELLRPMLRQWLAENMPRIVEDALRSELMSSQKPASPASDKA